MSDLLEHVPETLLMGPGPSTVPAGVYRAIATPTIGHMDPAFVEIMDALKERLRSLMRTANRMTLPMSGTGSAGMETVLVNLIEPGDPVLILINGVFGARMREVATRLGAAVTVREFDWGIPIQPDLVSEALAGGSFKIVAMVHAETSTGVASPVAEVGRLVGETGALFLVDAVTSLGGMAVDVDGWGIDALYSGTQKCLSCPPGLAPVTVSDRALETIRSRKAKVPNWYLDLNLLAGYWEGSVRSYHHTAPINMNYALLAAVDAVLDEGLEAVWARHRDAHEYLVAGLEDLGFRMLVEPDYRLPMLNTVFVPDGVDEKSLRARLLAEERIEVGGGLGEFAGKLWRVGLMGHTARRGSVDRLLGALRRML